MRLDAVLRKQFSIIRHFLNDVIYQRLQLESLITLELLTRPVVTATNIGKDLLVGLTMTISVQLSCIGGRKPFLCEIGCLPIESLLNRGHYRSPGAILLSKCAGPSQSPRVR